MSKYPWHELAVGESFTVPDAKGTNLRATAFKIMQRSRKRFSIQPRGAGLVVTRDDDAPAPHEHP